MERAKPGEGPAPDLTFAFPAVERAKPGEGPAPDLTFALKAVFNC